MKTYLKDIPKNTQLNGVIYKLEEVKEYYKDLSPDVRSFISIINDRNDVMRFTWVANNKWLVEYPIIMNQIHQQRYANEIECLQLIKFVNSNENFNNLESFIEVPVEEFTLDEMIEFKEEDEALLRGEELPVKKVIARIKEPVSIQSNKSQKRSFVIGEQIRSKKSSSSPTLINSKPVHTNSKKTKPSDDTSFFQL